MVVSEQRRSCSVHSNAVFLPRNERNSDEVVDAKKKELSNFQKFNVFRSVPDMGQIRLTTSWVLAEKSDGL